MMLGRHVNKGLKGPASMALPGIGGSRRQPARPLSQRESFSRRARAAAAASRCRWDGWHADGTGIAAMSFGSGALSAPDPRTAAWPAVSAPQAPAAPRTTSLRHIFPPPAAGGLKVNGNVSVYDTSGPPDLRPFPAAVSRWRRGVLHRHGSSASPTCHSVKRHRQPPRPLLASRQAEPQARALQLPLHPALCT